MIAEVLFMSVILTFLLKTILNILKPVTVVGTNRNLKIYNKGFLFSKTSI